MKIIKVTAELTIYAVCDDNADLSKIEFGDILESEIQFNGFKPSDYNIETVENKSTIPSDWLKSIPYCINSDGDVDPYLYDDRILETFFTN